MCGLSLMMAKHVLCGAGRVAAGLSLLLDLDQE
jgi:hypothetical protein